MRKIKILSIFGTRPEAVKMAPVVKAIENDDRFQSIVLVTAQHREMLDQVLSAFDIAPDYDLDVMEHGQPLCQITSKVLTGTSSILDEVFPDAVLVHGDTTTTFAAALAAIYKHIPVGHIEAGMRTGDITQPFPEELNRLLVARLSQWHFAADKQCVRNLKLEGIPSSSIVDLPHNTVVDSLLLAQRIINERRSVKGHTSVYCGKRVVATVHRRESWGKQMESIFEAFVDFSERHPEVRLSVVTHANPKIQKMAKRVMGDPPRIELIGHLGYLDFISLLSSADLIATDSGGVQEEGPTLGVPVVVLRNKTEYQDLLDKGAISLAGTKRDKIVEALSFALTDNIMRQVALEVSQERRNCDSTLVILERLHSDLCKMDK